MQKALPTEISRTLRTTFETMFEKENIKKFNT